MLSYVKLSKTIPLGAAINRVDTSAAADGTSLHVDFFLNGSTTAMAYSPTPGDSGAGLLNTDGVISTGNGFAVGDRFSVFLRATTADGIATAALLGDYLVTAHDIDDIYTLIGAAVGANISADIAAVKAVLPAALTAGGKIKASMDEVLAGTVPAPNVTGVPLVDVKYNLGTVAPAPTVAGIPKVEDATLQGRLTSARGGYLDNLNVGGNVASSSEVTSIQNNTRCVRVVPEVIERPDSSTVTYRIELLLYDSVGNMEIPDSAPTVSLVNQAGTDRSSRLDSTTMASVSTGRYRCIYTAAVGDTLEQLVWSFSVAEGSVTRIYGNTSVIVDTTAVDFTAADRTMLTDIQTDVDEMQTDAASGLTAVLAAITAAGFGASGEGSATYGDLLRLVVGVICGTVTDFTTDTQIYHSLNGAKIRLTVTTDETGRTVIVPGNLT